MNAVQLGFPDRTFNRVICIQNGISAFHTDPRQLIREAVRVTKPGGSAIFSTYADQFWPFRLDWFKVQAEAGLVGEIDYEKTGNGVIVCRDGFTATIIRPQEFKEYTEGIKAEIRIEEVDQSSVFYEIILPKVKHQYIADCKTAGLSSMEESVVYMVYCYGVQTVNAIRDHLNLY